MKRAAAALGLFLVLCGSVRAQSDRSFSDPGYLEAFKLVEQGKYTRVHELAEKMLAANPDSYTGAYLMGVVYEFGEGSLPRASFYLHRALREVERLWGKAPPENGPWLIHSQILYRLFETAGQLEHYQEQLQLCDRYRELYKVDLSSETGWTLMKLGRIDEARLSMLRSASSTDWETRSQALNTLGALESESNNLEAAYPYFSDLCQQAATHNDTDAVYLVNGASASRALLDYPKAEEHLLAATRKSPQSSYSNPWIGLAEVYTAEGRLTEAAQALKEMQEWRLASDARTMQAKWASCYTTAGAVLMAAGYDDEALHIFEKLANRPDRNYSTSSRPELVEGRLLFLYSLALRARCERIREEQCWCGWRRLLQTGSGAAGNRADPGMGPSGKTANLLVRDRPPDGKAEPVSLGGFIRPYGPVSLERPWLAPSAWRFFGAGPVAVSAEQEIAALPTQRSSHKPYLEAVLLEARASNSPSDSGIEGMADAILAKLPGPEVLLRNRVQGLLVAHFEAAGKSQQALPLLQHLMEVDPPLLRHLELRLPVSFQADGSPAAARAVRFLRRSPRLVERSGAFVLQVDGAGSQVEGRLQAPDGTVLGRYVGKGSAAAEDFCRAFQAQAFAPVLNLSQSDIFSIDGSTQASSAKSLQDLFKP